MPPKRPPSAPARSPSRPSLASTADRHTLYERSVQNAESEIDFVDSTFRALRGRRAARLREDFCGTASVCCEWVRRRPTNMAVGIDLDGPTLDWGREHNIAPLAPAAAKRVKLLERNVLDPGPGSGRMDIILAMNFSYWIFKRRNELRRYFERVRASLGRDGLLFMDIYGGWESYKDEHRELREIKGRGGKGGPPKFTYVWDQEKYDPITGEYLCHIHFRFPDGSKLNRAFTYDWRLWSLPEVRELLAEAGFSKSTVYWEGDDGKGGGNDIFEPADHAEQCPAFVAYLVAER